MIPALNQCKQITPSELPWVKTAEALFQTWHKVGPCMQQYAKFLEAHVGLGKFDAKRPVFPLDYNEMRATLQLMGDRTDEELAYIDERVAKELGEFYLCVAFRLRREEIGRAGSNNRALLEVAQRCAVEDFEPFLESAR